MAQYRAIFQNAYFKGLATAAVVTIGLAAGQAQAVDITNKAGWEGLSGSVTEKLAITSDIDASNDKEFTLTLSGADNTINAAKGTSKTATIAAAKGTIIVNGEQAALTIGAKANDSGTKASIKTLDIQKGTVTLTNTDQATALDISDSLILGDGGNLVISGSTETVTAGTKNKTTIKLGSGGTIELISGAVAGKQLIGTGGKIDVKADNDWTVGNYFEKETATANKQNISVATEKKLTIKLTGKNEVTEVTPDQRGVLHFASGSTVDLAAGASKTTTLEISNDGAKYGSIAKFDSGSKITVSATGTKGGAISVAGKADKGVGVSELHIDADVLDSFLKVDSDLAGAVILDANSKLQVNNKTVKFGDALASDNSSLTLAVASGDAYDAGKVVVKGGTTISAQDMVVEGKLGDALSGNLTLAADNLTLGKTGVDMSSKGTGVKELQAKNVTFIGKNGDTDFVLKEKLTLSNGNSVTGNVVVAGTGPLAIDGGTYSLSDKVTLSGGNVNVGSATSTNATNVSLSNLTINNAAANTITVAGANEKTATLNLTNTEFDLTGHATNLTKINVNEFGQLDLSGEQLSKLLSKGTDDWTTSTATAGFALNKGTINLGDSSIKLNASDFTSADAAADKKIAFHTTNGGTIKAKSMTLTETADAGLGIGASGNLAIADTLTIENTHTASGNFVVNTGNLAVGNIIQSEDTSAKLVIGKDGTSAASLRLGEIKSKTNHTSDQGQINVDLSLAGQNDSTRSTLKIDYGTWDAQSIATKNANIDIGAATISAAALQDVDHKWGLNAKKLALGSTGDTVNVYQNIDGSTQDQELTVAELTSVDGAKIKVHGDMTLNGKFSSGSDATSPDDDTYGLDIKAGTIVMQAGGQLTIDKDALTAINISGETVTLNGYTDGAITSATGSTVKLNFAADYGVITDKAVIELRKKLFGKTADTDRLEGTLNLGGAELEGLVVDKETNEIAWKDVESKKDIISDVTTSKLENAEVTGIKSTDTVRGTFGSLTSTEMKAGSQINTDENLTLGNAAGNQGYFAAQVDQNGNDGKVLGALGFKVKDNTNLTLKNGGIADKVTLGTGSKLVVVGNNNETTLTKITGDSGVVSLESGALKVTHEDGVVVGSLNSKAGSSLAANKLELKAATGTSKIAGDLNIAGKTTVSGSAEFSGNNQFGDLFTAKNDVEFTGGKTTFAKNANVTDLGVFGGAVDVQGALKLGSNTNTITVGQVSNTQEGIEGTTGSLSVNRLDLNGGTLVVDPDFGSKSSFAGVTKFGNNDQAADAGSVNGNLYALQNGIASVGNKDEAKVKEIFAQFIDPTTGSLQDPAKQAKGVGAIAYVADQVTLGATSKIVVDPATTSDANAVNYYGKKATEYAKGDIYIGTNAALAVDVSALNEAGKAAITFTKGADATVFAEDKDNSKFYITGSLADVNGGINLFDNSTNKVLLDGADSLTVQTLNGLYSKTYNKGEDLSANDIKLDFNKVLAEQQFSVVSEPVKTTLIALGSEYNDYTAETPADKILGIQAAGYYTDGTEFYTDEAKTQKVDAADPNKDRLVVETIDGQQVAYFKYDNKLLSNILVNGGNAVDAETVARLAVFGGAPQAAIEAGASTYEAISARMGVGVSGVSAAANGQGGAIWVTPVYKSAESDGFAADNKSYGADVTLYGLALGADIEVAPNFKVGGMFNVGSGDADGQGLGANVSNDFDYYGLGLYAGYSMDAFSLVADVTYTAVDNDIEGNTDLGKVKTSIDSTNLSVGVTGQYKLSVAGMDVTPHAGIRFSKLDIDDYATEYAQSSSDSLNIFSVPVGVTIAKEYVTDTWTVKPSFDLTLTGNFGDDEFEGNAQWATFSNLSTNVKSEIMDNFTYGAAVGVSATTGNFGLGLGVNYTGSSNTDEFGVNANARYMF